MNSRDCGVIPDAALDIVYDVRLTGIIIDDKTGDSKDTADEHPSKEDVMMWIVGGAFLVVFTGWVVRKRRRSQDQFDPAEDYSY